MRYGYFDNQAREYVIDRVDLPVSWTNYLGVEDTCAVVNHTAGGYLFYKSPEYHRISRPRRALSKRSTGAGMASLTLSMNASMMD